MKFCQFSKITFRAAAVDRQRADERGPRQHFYSNANISIFVIFFLINFLARKSFWLFEFNNEITETASYNMKILYLYRKKPIKPSFWKKNLFERFADCAVEDLLGLETFMSLKIFLQAKQMFPSSSISNEFAVFSPNSSLPKITNFIYMLTSLRHSPESVCSGFPFILLSLQKV